MNTPARIATLIPDDALLFDVAESAAGQHLHVLTNGRRTVLSPVVLDGWTKVRIGIKSPTRATLTPFAQA